MTMQQQPQQQQPQQPQQPQQLQTQTDTQASQKALQVVNHDTWGFAVDGRSLHEYLEIGKDFTNWCKDQIKRLNLIENKDFGFFAEIGENPPTQTEPNKGGRPKKNYIFSLDASKHISMASQTEMGRLAREYFIRCESVLMESGFFGNQNGQQAFPKNEQKEVSNEAYDTAARSFNAQVGKNLKMGMDDFTARQRAVDSILERHGVDYSEDFKISKYYLMAMEQRKHLFHTCSHLGTKDKIKITKEYLRHKLMSDMFGLGVASVLYDIERGNLEEGASFQELQALDQTTGLLPAPVPNPPALTSSSNIFDLLCSY